MELYLFASTLHTKWSLGNFHDISLIQKYVFFYK